MKANPLKQSVLLAAVVGLFCLALAAAGALAPMAVLPKLDLPAMLALALAALWSAPKLCWSALLANAALGGVSFALLPWCAGVSGGVPVLTMGLAGGAVFGAASLLYTAAMERIATGPKAPLAPAGTALLLFLAGQCLSGLL